MSKLPSRWHAAAALSGRIDLSQAVLVHPGRVAALSPAQLQDLGVSRTHALRLSRGTPLTSPHPYLTLDDAAYPEALRPLPFAPPVLFHLGDQGLLKAPVAVAIVGARSCTHDGRRMARALARAVEAAGGVVVSGMAHGIDTAAHLAAPGRTIAVLGHGLAVARTEAAERTAQRILGAGGLLLSEFPPTFPAARHTFPQRNRVIAGLAQLTVVVEASLRSGAGITARLALDAGREVGAVPGSPYAKASAGCLALLSQGAALIRGPADLLGLLGLPIAPAPGDTGPPLDPLLAALDPSGTPFDTLMTRVEMPASALAAALGALELQGRVKRLPGGRFLRIG